MRAIVALVFFALPAAATLAAESPLSSCESCRIALVPHEGTNAIDQQIIKAQAAVAKARAPVMPLENLGWLFVSKARASYDAGFYKLAEQCAQCMECIEPKNLDAQLLRGHVLQSLHRFKDAEKIARDLVAQRGRPFDYGLLGDALIDEGNVKEAAEAYQQMIDIKPDLQSYVRAGQIRWLMGDVEGAIEVSEMAARASSPRDAESAAWAYTRFAFYAFAAGRCDAAMNACDTALRLSPDYAAALLLRGRVLLSQKKTAEAVTALQRAADLNPLPEYQWALADALRENSETEKAAVIEGELVRSGAAEDPRSFALFLATRGEETGRALELAQEELITRGDMFTLDAFAWALRAAGRPSDATEPMQRALAEGTKDARLFFHAGTIAAENGKKEEARAWFDKAVAMQQLLLPSERNLMTKQMAGLDGSGPEMVQDTNKETR